MATSFPQSLDTFSATDIEVTQWCEHARKQSHLVVGGVDGGNLVLRLNDTCVVKYGIGLSIVEFENQLFAHNTYDLNIVRVPKVHRFFEHPNHKELLRCHRTGYLIMEWIDGTTLHQMSLETQSGLFPKILRAIEHISATTRAVPGPAFGGESIGCIWGDSGSCESFESIEQMERWFHRALEAGTRPICLAQFSLCFCHLDLNPRNLMVDNEHNLCILDWASAGFYPKVFMRWAMAWANQYIDYFKQLQEGMAPMTDNEVELYDVLWIAYRNNMRNHCSTQLQTQAEHDVIMSTLSQTSPDGDVNSLHPSLLQLQEMASAPPDNGQSRTISGFREGFENSMKAKKHKRTVLTIQKWWRNTVCNGFP